MPLPLEVELPIHINGFFNLNSSRDNLSSDSGQTGKDRPRAIWNHLLVRHVLAHACASLIVDLVQDIGQDNPEEFYQFWLVNKITVSKALENLHHYVTQLLYHQNVVRSAVNGAWITPTTIKVISEKWWEKLVAPLRADKIDISEPQLPPSILSAFQNAGCLIKTFQPSDLRKHLIVNKPLGIPIESADKESLRNRQWIVDMLNYCLSDNHLDLRGLPLAILANDTLQVFGYNPIGTIYIANDLERQIFANYPEWFLYPSLYQQVVLNNRIGVSVMDAKEVAQKLFNVIGSTPSSEHQWQPDAPNPPNANWLTKVYHYFTNLRQGYLPHEELKKVPLVPGDDEKLHQGGSFNTPLLCISDIDKQTLAAVKYFGVLFVKAPPNLEEAIANFRNRHPSQLIFLLTGRFLLNILHERYTQGLPPYDQQHYTSLLNFLADHRWLSTEQGYNNTAQHNQLRELPIYPTNSNELVSLNEENVYIPGDGYEPPEIAGTLRLLRLGTAKHEWLPLFQMLEVPVLNRARLIRDCLLDEYTALAPEEQLTALAWIRDNLSAVRQELQKERQSFTALESEIKKARLVRCTDGRLRSASLIYSPDSDVVRNILGNRAAIPDMEFYSPDSAVWLDFFEKLGMQNTPSPDDLLACVDSLIQTANRSGLEAVADDCITIFNYIVDNWESLKEVKVNHGTKKLPEALIDKPWLPVERNPENLQQYAGAIVPENRLYRAKDICFLQDACLVASQKPIFARHQRDLLKVEIRHQLGFQPIEPKMVLEHFDIIIQFGTMWSDRESLTSVKVIYKYLYDTFLENRAADEQKLQLKENFQHRKCLWDESTGKFWKPIDAFQDDVPFFGSRRITIPFSHRTGEVYQLLGQRRSPGVENYLYFLQELAEEYDSQPLSEEDKHCVIQVLQRLESQLSLEGRLVKNLPVLTDDYQLRQADQVFLPDAPWRKDYIERNRLLHFQVPVKLAKSSGCLSLLRDVYERPTDVNTALNTKGNQWCEEWQKTLNSPELQTGVKRLIFHEHDSEPIIDIIWLTTAKVLPATHISVDLFLNNETKIASAIPGTYYFDEFKRIFYVICSSSRYIMLCYLASTLNNQLGKYALQNLLPLASIIDAEPQNINGLLNELRIRALPGDNNSQIVLATSEENFKVNEENVAVQWAVNFYKWLGYTRISRTDTLESYNLDCNGAGLLSLKAQVKAINSKHSYIHITNKEWSTMLKFGQAYDLLLIIQRNELVDEIIQISDIWNTLTNAEYQFQNKLHLSGNLLNEPSEFLIKFSNASESDNELILNWHNLVENFSEDKIRRYRPLSSKLSSENEAVEFQKPNA